MKVVKFGFLEVFVKVFPLAIVWCIPGLYRSFFFLLPVTCLYVKALALQNTKTTENELI